ncbi:helicase [Salmonella enterica subsp. enterica]|uniref:protein kinase domain-containing protein n=1 Tax=Salmonella enterica TaxID=28901 RepID=UPI001CE3DFD2|nr:helicase [Salmonella enterica]
MREHKVLGFIHEQNEQLDSVVLQPLSHPTRDDIDADFCELYRLPSRQLRLNEFIQRFGEDLEFCERVNFVKVLLSHAADLHDLGVAHRDISDHTIWLERPSKISISGFLTAYFPELGTVGSLRDQLRASKTILPEDSEIGQGEASDPFRRDVYLLAVVIHHILFLQAPKQEDSLFVWNSPTDFEVDPQLSTWFETALDLIPAGRFSDARTMLNSFNTLSLGYPEKTGIDLRRFEPYRSELIPMVIYPIEENIKQGISHLYKSTFSGESVSVKVWYGRKPDIKRPEEALQLQNFLDKARLIKSQPCSSLAEVIDFGISDAGTYLVQKWLNGEFLNDAVKSCHVGRELILLCKKIVRAVLHLHAMQLQHGDLHPNNILIEVGDVRFIDALDIPCSGENIIFTPAYVPTDYESLPMEERDCYAVAKVCNEILEHDVNWEGIDPSALLNEIRSCMGRDFKIYSLDRINDEIEMLINPPQINEGVRLSVLMRQLTSSQKLINDNGVYHISISEERVRSPKQQPHIIVAFAGVRKQLQIYLKATQLDFAFLRTKDIAHSLFVRMASQAITQLEANILFEPSSADDPSKLLEHVKKYLRLSLQYREFRIEFSVAIFLLMRKKLRTQKL